MLRVARMYTSSPSRDTTSRFPRPAPLWRRLALCLAVAILLGLGLGIWQASTDRLPIRVHPMLLALGGAGYMGLLAGLTVDIVLRRRSRLLRFVTAMAMLLAWMGASALSAALAGVDPLHVAVGAGYWLEFGQLAIGGLCVVVALLVCRAARRGPAPPAEDLEWVADRRGLRPKRASLLWRGLVPGLILAVCLGLGLGILQIYAYFFRVLIPDLAAALAGAGFLGLLLGGWCRLALRDRAGALRFAVALVALAAGVTVFQGVWVALLQGLNPLLGYTVDQVLWTALGQLVVGGLCIVVASLVWRSPANVAGQRELPSSIPQQSPAPTPAAPGPGRTGWQVPPPPPEPRRPTVALPPAVPARRGPRFRLPPLRLPTRSRAQNRTRTRVIAAEEDRCPYCLDTVASDDPRGVIVCSVCGTPHHRDCWTAAGSKCQVPHLNV